MTFAGWVKLRKYCELTGDTPAGVHAKRRAGHFLDGTHTKVAGDGNLYVNIEAAQRWVTDGLASGFARTSTATQSK